MAALDFDRWRGKVAVLTGAGGGIGSVIATRLVKEGLEVVGVDLDLRSLESLAETLDSLEQQKDAKDGYRSGKLHPYQADIRNDSELIAAVKFANETVGPIHILINCAGAITPNGLTDGDPVQWRRIFDVNVIALCIATKEAAKLMMENGIDGHIIHFNSETGHVVPNYPHLNVYPASKFAVTALTESLRTELARLKSKIKITSISPGHVDTNLAIKNGFKTPSANSDKQSKYAASPKLKTEDIAEAIFYILSTPAHVQIQELTIKPVGGMF